MSWNNVRLVFLREVRDQLRDRRTLFVILVLPLLLYPGLGIGTVQLAVLFTEQPRTVVVLGRDNLPAEPALLDGDRIAENWFRSPSDSAKLEVVSDGGESSGNDNSDPREALLSQARVVRAKMKEKDRLERELELARRAGGRTNQLQRSLQSVRGELARSFSNRMQVLIIVPDGFDRHLTKVNRDGVTDPNAAPASRPAVDPQSTPAETPFDREPILDATRPQIVHNVADEKSMIAYRRVKEALDAWEHEILKRRLERAGLDASWAEPVNADAIDLAENDQLSANLWSKLFPALLVIMTVTGAFYPAVDVAAGEKERGTMETLLICPARRSEIVVGKFLTVMLASVSTAVLNLASIGFTGKYLSSIAGARAFDRVGDLALPSPLAMFWVFVLMLPLAALFSALCLALATFARSSKEGQYYLSPLLMITMGLTVFCLSPAVEIRPFYSVMPVVGPALLLKELIVTPQRGETLIYAVPVLLTSVLYSLLALWWAIEQFQREEVLFREAERFDLRLWVRHVLRDKEPTPSFTEAGICFTLIMLLQFGALKFFQGIIQDSGGGSDTLMLRLLLVQQLVIIASPALFMGVLLTTSMVRTFRLRLPNWRMMCLAVVLPLALHPLSLEISAALQKWFFLPLPESFSRQLRALSDPAQPLWVVILAFAVAPAICEELAFRGFILSGFSRSRRMWLAIWLSSVTFGVMHVIPQQVFNATLLGVVLGLIAVRSNSLLPAVVFHFVYNSTEVFRQRLGAQQLLPLESAKWFVFVDDGGIRYQWTTLLIAAALAVVLVRRLVKSAEHAPDHEPMIVAPERNRTLPKATAESQPLNAG
jgi:sodium transport system permease protein